MEFNVDVQQIDYHERLRNLDVTAKSQVKSNKFFPVFGINGKEKIFKPLSKTKPLTTPYFSYSEVVWSTIFHTFFDTHTPIYELAIIKNIEEDFESKYHHGVLVDNLVTSNENLVNLYDYFCKHPDSIWQIKDYINCCMLFYNYEKIFETQLLKENPSIRNDFAYQLLCSILKLDQNFHYENILFKQSNDTLELAPMIDHEFSTAFLFLDNLELHQRYFLDALYSLLTEEGILFKNLKAACYYAPESSKQFLENLKNFLEEIKQKPIVLKDNGYLVPFNSNNYKIGEALYKEKDLEKARQLEEKLKMQQYSPSIDELSEVINNNIVVTSEVLKRELELELK